MMKKLIFFIVFLVITLNANSQTIGKREDIFSFKLYKSIICNLTAHRFFDADTLTEINIQLSGFDHAYPLTRAYITLLSNSPVEFSKNINDIEAFFSQDIGTSTIINNGETFISIEKAGKNVGGKMVFIHDDGVSYTALNLETIKKVKAAFNEWVFKNKIALN